jgi:hypothetical protein
MKNIAICCLLAILSGSLMAQARGAKPAAPAAPAKEAVPALSPDLRAKFWRREAELLAAEKSVDSARLALDAVRAEMIAACGRQALNLDPSGEPACVPLPPAPAAKEAGK